MAAEKTTNQYLVAACLSVLLLLLPFFFCTFVPATDLPQHLAQITLLESYWNNQITPYAVDWLAPNSLVYAVIYAYSKLFPAILAGKMTMISVIVTWVAGIFFVAYKFQRPVSNAILASVLVFNMSFYWGFLNFLSGWPIFALAIVYFRNVNKPWEFVRASLILLLLYFAHILWFLAGIVWLGFILLTEQKSYQAKARLLLTVIPAALLTVIWYPAMVAKRSALANTGAHWRTTLGERVRLDYLTDSFFGGIYGKIETIFAVILMAWLILAFLVNRKGIKEQIDKQLLVFATAMLIALLVFFPDSYMNTLHFARRWMPVAAILLLLASPGLPRAGKALAFIFVMSFAGTTAAAWKNHEEKELTGLEAALAATPGKANVLGLDFQKYSLYVKGRPFLQTFAYTQAIGAGEVNFSFAEHFSSIVTLKKPTIPPWTPGLEWDAEWVQAKDLAYFDYVLMNAVETEHPVYAAVLNLVPITQQGRWRLYATHRQ